MERKRETNPDSAARRLRHLPKLSRSAVWLLAVAAFGACWRRATRTTRSPIRPASPPATSHGGGRRRHVLRGLRADRQDRSRLRQEEEGLRRVSSAGGRRSRWREAGRLGRPRPHRHQLRLDAQHRLPRALHAGRLRAAHLRPGAQEERRPPDDAELRGVRLRVSRVLRRGLRLPVRRGRGQCGAREPRRHADAESVSARQRAVGLPGRQGLLPDRPGL